MIVFGMWTPCNSYYFVLKVWYMSWIITQATGQMVVFWFSLFALCKPKILLNRGLQAKLQKGYLFLVFLLLLVFCLSLTVDFWTLVVTYKGTGEEPNENESYWNLFFRIIIQPFSFIMVGFLFFVYCKIRKEGK